MRASSDMTIPSDGSRWTPGWVVLISFLTPASAWALHTVMPDLVAWYLGVMGWLILTPEKRPRLSFGSQVSGPKSASVLSDTQTVAATGKETNTGESSDTGDSETPQTGIENSTTKSRKPRTRARKPKALTLAEVKALTGGADRAVVWSQVGPGKFVRQPGDDVNEAPTDTEMSEMVARYGSPNVIETVVTNSTILEDQNTDLEEDRLREPS